MCISNNGKTIGPRVQGQGVEVSLINSSFTSLLFARRLELLRCSPIIIINVCKQCDASEFCCGFKITSNFVNVFGEDLFKTINHNIRRNKSNPGSSCTKVRGVKY
jgi:hypothetical protein